MIGAHAQDPHMAALLAPSSPFASRPGAEPRDLIARRAKTTLQDALRDEGQRKTSDERSPARKVHDRSPRLLEIHNFALGFRPRTRGGYYERNKWEAKRTCIKVALEEDNKRKSDRRHFSGR